MLLLGGSSETRYTLQQAAVYCQTSLHVIRKRADRGTLPVIRCAGVRYVTHQALEEAGLIPDSELVELRRDRDRLHRELSVHRRLAETGQAEAEAEREGHRRVTAAYVEAQARVAELEQLERDLATAGPIRAWRLARERRKLPDDKHASPRQLRKQTAAPSPGP